MWEESKSLPILPLGGFLIMKRGKKYVEAAKLIDRATLYEATDAVALVKKSAVAKFDETIEAHIRTGCDGRHADQQIRGAVVLPHGTGKTVKVLVFAKGAKAEEAEAAGADFVGGEELIPKIQNDNWFDFDVVVATGSPSFTLSPCLKFIVTSSSIPPVVASTILPCTVP